MTPWPRHRINSRNCLGLAVALAGFFLIGLTRQSAAAEPVQFEFQLSASPQNPFARDVWAEVLTPARTTLHLPAFYAGDDRFAVRARAAEPGEYFLGKVTEKEGGRETVLPVEMISSDHRLVGPGRLLRPVGLDKKNGARFVLVGGDSPFTPVGMNLVCANRQPVAYYRQALAALAQHDLNWVRIWMAHWDGLNLDWLPPEMGASPPPGTLDLRVAAEWDEIVAAAEEHGVYLQIVLQSHGQYSSKVNPNWAENPWNAASPRGFLKNPGEFFTSPAAKTLSARKYRYIVARWGYSPAVMAWELFNEVHWTDPINLGHSDATVAQWHADLAAYIRSVDVYGHLITTSTENLRSPLYDRMDYFQPHLYPYDILTGPLAFQAPVEKLNRPVFYGETGDDHAPLSDAQKEAGLALVPPVWASLMGPGPYPAQPWLGEKLIETDRLGEQGAVARFVAASGLGAQQDLASFSPAMECKEQTPLVLLAGQVWQRRAAPDLVLPVDGGVPLALADIPSAYVGSPKGQAEGFPGRATYHINFPAETRLWAHVAGVGMKGSAIRISIDGKPVVEKVWPAGTAGTPDSAHPVELPCTVPSGAHTLVVENPGAQDWFQLDKITTDWPVPVLAALGKRNDRFIALWLWHRTGVMALTPPAAVGGTLLLAEVPAGRWTVTWWDTLKGVAAPPREIEHRGGLLRLPVPAFNRHAAVVLTR